MQKDNPGALSPSLPRGLSLPRLSQSGLIFIVVGWHPEYNVFRFTDQPGLAPPLLCALLILDVFDEIVRGVDPRVCLGELVREVGVPGFEFLFQFVNILGIGRRSELGFQFRDILAEFRSLLFQFLDLVGQLVALSLQLFTPGAKVFTLGAKIVALSTKVSHSVRSVSYSSRISRTAADLEFTSGSSARSVS